MPIFFVGFESPRPLDLDLSFIGLLEPGVTFAAVLPGLLVLDPVPSPAQIKTVKE